VTYWFRQGGLAAKLIRPYAGIGGGMAQVDAKVPVTVYDCHDQGATREACGEGETDVPVDAAGDTVQKKLDAWKKLGQGFVELSGGVVFAVKDQIGIQVNVNGMYMLGSSGLVIQPSLGFIYGL
jgi:hypothetical protein